MAAKSSRDSSSSSYRCSYHAFLSFRGQDTRRGFTDHLYRALELAGIHTFRDDDEIKRGENIESELEKAIQESQVSIIVFSKDYASSRWCLNELLKIVERRNTDHRHVVLPVFYEVDPSDVRKQSGPFAEAFARHEERFSTEMDKVEQWRRALGDVASLGGMVLGDRVRKILRASCSTLLAKERLLEVIKNDAMIKNNITMKLQGTFDCCILSIFVQGSKIPDRFNYRSMGNTVFSIIVPSHLNLKIVGLNACILYARQSDRSLEVARGHDVHSLEVTNETKGRKWNLRMRNEVEWNLRMPLDHGEQ
ncbi:hypothetical protein DVH24_030747 [Malus domestica]|uniref:ADP-ribosyl cyclase/cyclic ADP-ribose hydrolase n=1 Tax=Malus domestica TaxID=3750 RepID=A0A498HDR3_MALDO|nr:hypothetical protein DVH24_030747 [Malus domestica]